MSLVAVIFCTATVAAPPILPPRTPFTLSDENIKSLENPQIVIEYVAPTNNDLIKVYDDLKQRQVLEQIKVFLAPLRLPNQLTIKADQCDAPTRPRLAEGPITLCYEYISWIASLAPVTSVRIGIDQRSRENPGALTRDDALTGPVVHQLFFEIGKATLDILNVPVWGQIEDASDRVAAFIMLNFGKDVAWKTLIGSSWFLSQANMTGSGFNFVTARSPEVRRFYNLLCLAYGSDQKTFAFLVRDYDLPQSRARGCGNEYRKLQFAFNNTVMPHVDRELLKRTQAIEWLKAEIKQ